MPRRRGETNQQWMDRLRAAREVMNDPNYMTRVRAARDYTNRATNDAGTELVAFMALFHPDFDKDKVREMANDIRAEQHKRY